MTSTLRELFVGAPDAAKLLDHRTPRALALLKEHHEGETTHDVKRITATYGEHSRWVLNGTAFDGLEALEQAHVAVGFGNEGSFGDIALEVFRYLPSQDAITVEFAFKGRHTGEFAGVPATGRPVEFPVVGVYSFDVDGKLVQENITFDTAAVLRQIS